MFESCWAHHLSGSCKFEGRCSTFELGYLVPIGDTSPLLRARRECVRAVLALAIAPALRRALRLSVAS